jgi:hypothetical protein
VIEEMLGECIRSSFSFSCKIDINDRVNNLSNFFHAVGLIARVFIYQ